MNEEQCRCGHSIEFHNYFTGPGPCDFNGKCPSGCAGFSVEEYGWRIATSMEDLEIGQVIASYARESGPEELVRAGRIVEFDGLNALVDNEDGETKRIGLRGDNTVFILADPPVDPAEEAWLASPVRIGNGTYLDDACHAAFIAGWKTREES